MSIFDDNIIAKMHLLSVPELIKVVDELHRMQAIINSALKARKSEEVPVNRPEQK